LSRESRENEGDAMPTPDRRWIDYIKLAFGFALLFAFTALAIIIGLGKVESATSFGLGIVLTAMAQFGNAWGQWAFKVRDKEDDKEPE